MTLTVTTERRGEPAARPRGWPLPLLAGAAVAVAGLLLNQHLSAGGLVWLPVAGRAALTPPARAAAAAVRRRRGGGRGGGRPAGAFPTAPSQASLIPTRPLPPAAEQAAAAATRPASRAAGQGALPSSSLPPLLRARRASADLASCRQPPPEDAAERPTLRLEVVSGVARGSVFESKAGEDEARFLLFSPRKHLSRPQLDVGRLAANRVVLSDVEVSSQHARLRWSAAAATWQLCDLGSLNGTQLNGAPLGRPGRARGAWVALREGDLVVFGERDESPAAVVSFHPAPTGEQAQPPPPPTPPPPEPRLSSTQRLEGSSAPPLEGSSAPPLRLAHAAREDAARGRPSEDRSGAECPLRGFRDVALFTVLDGHCGGAAAAAALAMLPPALSAELAALPAGWREEASGAERALHNAFLGVDARLGPECLYAGCAATALLVWRAADGSLRLQSGNVGDAGAALGARISGAPRPGFDPGPPACAATGHASAALTEAHKVSSESERRRLRALGVALRPGENRLGGLSLSRALGDHFLKQGGEATCGLIAAPHCSAVHALAAGEQAFCVLASDGLWDVASARDAVRIAAQAGCGAAGAACEVAAAALVAHARQKRSKDDVTALVVRLAEEAEEV